METFGHHLSYQYASEDQLDYDDNVSNFNNTDLSLSGLSHTLNPDLSVAIPINAQVASNQDDREYLGYPVP